MNSGWVKRKKRNKEHFPKLIVIEYFYNMLFLSQNVEKIFFLIMHLFLAQ